MIHRQGEHAKNGTINLELALVRHALTLAMRAGKIVRVPFIARLVENNVRAGFFEQHEFEAILAKLPHYLRPVMIFAYYTGWRVRSEILGLTWDQVDLATGTVRLEVGSTKNKDGRIIYVTAELQSLLEQQWQEHIRDYPECPYVFHRKGQRIKVLIKEWQKARKEAGLPTKLMHDFRRTAVRNMVRAGIPERVAMQISGHKTRSIFDRYHIVSDADLVEAAQRLETFIHSDRHKFRHKELDSKKETSISSGKDSGAITVISNGDHYKTYSYLPPLRP
jgi:integrase